MPEVSTNIQSDPENAFASTGIEVPEDDVTVDVPETEETASTTTDAERAEELRIETEARDAGWVPEDEWRGPKDKWKPASEYVDFKNHVLPVVQKENAELKRKLIALEAREAERDRAQQERDREIIKVTLRRELAEATDDEEREKVMDRILDLKIKEAVAPPKPNGQQVSPEQRAEWESFYADNDWLKTDPRLQRQFAVEISKALNSGAYRILTDALEDSKDIVKRMFPERFTKVSSMAEGGGNHGAARSSNGKSWGDLTPRAKSNFEAILNDLNLTGEARTASMKRMLFNCSDEHFRR